LYNLTVHTRSHTGERPYKCTFSNCGREFYDKGNLKYHEKTSHSDQLKTLPYACEHVGCNLKFYNQKQKLHHHHNIDPECKNEKHALINVLGKFKKKFFLNFVNKNNFDKEKLNAIKEYQELLDCYNDTENRLFDADYFLESVGKNFTDNPNILN